MGRSCKQSGWGQRRGDSKFRWISVWTLVFFPSVIKPETVNCSLPSLRSTVCKFPHLIDLLWGSNDDIQMLPDSQCFNLGFLTLWWYKGNMHSVKTVLQILNLDLFSDQWCHRPDAWGSDGKPRLSVSHEDERLILYSVLCCYGRVFGRWGVLNAFLAYDRFIRM